MANPLSKRDLLVLGLGAAIIASGIGLALRPEKAASQALGTRAFQGAGPQRTAGPVEAHAPLLVRFVGDLEKGGLPGPMGRRVPFVVGEVLELNVEARNATSFRWLCNGRVVPADGRAWSPKRKRHFPLDEPGTYRFRVEARREGTPKAARPLEKELAVQALKILSFASLEDPLSERYLTGQTIMLAVDMADAIRSVPYRYRYRVNGQVVKNPEDEGHGEWGEMELFPYTFQKPGTYLFEVEARRASAKGVEDRVSLEAPIVVGDAVLEFFLADPERGARGTPVTLQAFVSARTERSQARFGVKDLRPGQKYVWIKDEKERAWGPLTRAWIPAKSGNYRLRVEVRPGKGKPAQDFRELLYVVVEGDSGF